jgi:mannose-6-phosphate isomerase-like protein (cupin superfamily)
MPACGTRQRLKATDPSTALSIGITDNQTRNMTISVSDSRTKSGSSIPPDDRMRTLIAARSNDQDVSHIGLVGDTYTILLAGKDTAGRFCLIDMHVPPGGGPPPHRLDFEESFIILKGEIEATFRGVKSVAGFGETVHIPANAPHQFHNKSGQSARLLCICSPAGQEEFFAQVGVAVATRTTAPPKLDGTAQAEFKAKAEALAPKYQTELLQHG